MQDDCYLPWHKREISPLSLKSQCSSEVVRNGYDRGDENCWIGNQGDEITYTLPHDMAIKEIRLIFDSDLNRKGHNMPCRYPLGGYDIKMPATLMKSYTVIGTDQNGHTFTVEIENNYQRFVKLPVDWVVSTVRFKPRETYGCSEFRVFSFEIQ